MLKKGMMFLALGLLALAPPLPAAADWFTIDRCNGVTVLVSQTYYSMPDVNALNWDDDAFTNEVAHGGWGSSEGAEWISELSGASGPAASYRVYHLGLTLPTNVRVLTGRLDSGFSQTGIWPEDLTLAPQKGMG